MSLFFKNGPFIATLNTNPLAASPFVGGGANNKWVTIPRKVHSSHSNAGTRYNKYRKNQADKLTNHEPLCTSHSGI